MPRFSAWLRKTMQSPLMSKGRFMIPSVVCYVPWTRIQTFLTPRPTVNFARTSKATIMAWGLSLGCAISNQQSSRRFLGLPLIAWAFGPGTLLLGSRDGRPMGCPYRIQLTNYEDLKERRCIFRFSVRRYPSCLSFLLFAKK